MRPPDKLKKPHVHRPASLWGTHTIAGGRIIQQGTSNLGSSWSALMTAFPAQVVKDPTGKGDFLDLLQTRKNWTGI